MSSLDRRSFLLAGLGAAGTGVLAACTGHSNPSSGMPAMAGSTSGDTMTLVSPSGSQVAAVDATRTRSGRTSNTTLNAQAGMVDLGGLMVNTWSFGGHLPGPQLRISAGDTLAATVTNHLPAPTSVHWHGVALRNDMDGVSPVTQPAIAAGAGFTYRFTTDQPGTYWFHPHAGVQLDRGLYGPLIVEDPHEPLSYDDEWVVVLDDWLDGTGTTPDQLYTTLTQDMSGMGGTNTTPTPSSTTSMSGMDMGSSAMPSTSTASSSMGGMSGSTSSASSYVLTGATSPLLGGDAGDVKYPYYLINGRVPASPDVYTGKPGHRVRIRIINAGGDTAFRLALGSHKLTITHTDGYPVVHQTVDALLIAPGERYDILVTLADGVFPLTTLAEGKNAAGRALVRTGPGAAPAANVRPAELNGMIMTASQLTAADDVRLAARIPDRTHRLELTGGMTSGYNWAINGVKFDMNNATTHPFLATQRQRVRLQFVNSTTMWHPMHLHGHTYQLGATGPRKDTTIVLPRQTVTCDLDTDNPGQWLIHCHNAYHGEAGMMGLLAYTA